MDLSTDSNIPHCPRCGSLNIFQPPIRTGRKRWLSKEMIMLVVGISAPDPAYPNWRCRNCNEWWMEKGYGG